MKRHTCLSGISATLAAPALFSGQHPAITLPAGQPKCFCRVIGIHGTADDTDGESALSPGLRTAH